MRINNEVLLIGHFPTSTQRLRVKMMKWNEGDTSAGDRKARRIKDKIPVWFLMARCNYIDKRSCDGSC